MHTRRATLIDLDAISVMVRSSVINIYGASIYTPIAEWKIPQSVCRLLSCVQAASVRSVATRMTTSTTTRAVMTMLATDSTTDAMPSLRAFAGADTAQLLAATEPYTRTARTVSGSVLFTHPIPSHLISSDRFSSELSALWPIACGQGRRWQYYWGRHKRRLRVWGTEVPQKLKLFWISLFTSTCW